MGLFVVRAGVKEDIRTELEKYVVGGLSAMGGFGISEFTGEYIVKAARISEAWQKLLVKALTKVGFGLLFAGLSWMTGGILSWILFAMAMGSVGGIAMDLIEYLYPAGIKGAAELLAVGRPKTEVKFEEPKFELPKEEAPKEEAPSELPAETPVTAPEVMKGAELYA